MKDKRYDTIFNLIEGGHIKVLSDMFETVPRSTVARDIRKNKDDLDARLEDMTQFTLHELARIADLVGVAPEVIIGIVTRELTAKKKWHQAQKK